jgi:DNA-binding response OmpR family regulator
VLANDSVTAAKILMVDDEDSNLRLLETMLRRAGYSNITSATDPRLALPLYSDFQPDLVLLDLMMPRMDGFQVMEELKRQVPDGTYLPIVVLTADTSRQSRKRALSMGASDFLTKPFDQQEVILRVRNLLETRSLSLRLLKHQAALEERVEERTEELRNSLGLLERTAEEYRRLLDRMLALNASGAR